jgi:hypothetical protein
MVLVPSEGRLKKKNTKKVTILMKYEKGQVIHCYVIKGGMSSKEID